MKLPATQTSDFKACPAGSHVAICNAVIDLGLQPGSDAFPAPKHQVYIRFEIPGERISYKKDDREVEGPMSIGRTFTASMNEKANLRHFVEGMYAKKFPGDEAASNFDLKAILGKKCMINVKHNAKGGKTYANLDAASPLPKGITDNSVQENESIYFSLDEAPGDVDRAFGKLPKWLQTKIEGRLLKDAPRNASAPVAAGDFDDDIPF